MWEKIQNTKNRTDNNNVWSLTLTAFIQHGDIRDTTDRAQDIKRCQLCPGKDRKSAAEIVCSSCHVNLCKDCVGLHMVSDRKVKHEVLTFEFTSEIIAPQCNQHEGQGCEMFCESCGSPLCPQCLSSDSHTNHNVQHITEIYNSRQETIKQDINELGNKIAPDYESIISKIQLMITNVIQKHGERNQSITKFGDSCHNLIDSVINRYLQDSKQIEKEDTDSLLALKSVFENLQSSLHSAINENASILASRDSSKLIHYISKNKEFRHVPSRVELTVPQFSPGELTEKTLCQLMGDIEKTVKTYIQGYVIKGISSSSVPRKSFLDKPRVIRSVETYFHKTFGIKCIPNKHQFYVSGDSEIIKHMNIEGEVLEDISTEPGGILDLAISREGFLVYSESRSTRINIRKNDQIECLISPQEWTPLSICCTITGELLVAMKSLQNRIAQSRVVRYCGSVATQEIRFDNAEQALYSCPLFIEENKNLDIIVSDSGEKIIVVDRLGKLRFIYDGNLQSQMYKTFTPRGVTTNSICQILIADPSNQVIHIIDENGQFLMYIKKSELQEPYDLCSDSDDILFVTELRSGKVKELKLFS
ncbi:uncharacterized protein LOC134271758 [Saccostrea cucullata]|uniref:uncharacterized protein LOC134271758 n=1 Tax=Saccostrea cuccullata TaxID=36930 RepID=UPI002ED03DDE